MKIGLDTNILVRVFAEDHSTQRAAAIALLDQLSGDSKAVVNTIVVVELVWTLSRSYRFDRREIEIALERLTRHPKIFLQDLDAIREAVHRSRENGEPIVDCLIALKNRSLGCVTTITFDQQAARADHFELLQA